MRTTARRRAPKAGRLIPARNDSHPLTDNELDQFRAEFERLPAPMAPPDLSTLDGFLCGVLVQPRPIAPARWLLHVADLEGAAPPPGCELAPVHGFALRRHAELDRAIARRDWFDPWVFAADAPDSHTDTTSVVPWVTGFACAMEQFPGLLDGNDPALTLPLALLFRHLDAADLEDADALLAEIEALEAPADLSAAIEELVRSVLLLADVGRPLHSAGRLSC